MAPDLLTNVTEAFPGDSQCLHHCSHVIVPCESPGGAEGPITQHELCTAQPNPELWAEEGLRHPTVVGTSQDQTPHLFPRRETLWQEKSLGFSILSFLPKTAMPLTHSGSET